MTEHQFGSVCEHEYEVGDVIEYVAHGGSRRHVRVTAKADNKNGRPGFDGVMLNDPDCPECEVWGYDSQITRVVERRAA